MHSVQKKIMIADDHPLLIDGLSAIISAQANLSICATATSGKQLIQYIPVYKPDLIILDINLPEIDGIEAAKIIVNSYPLIKILNISTYFSDGLLSTLKSIPVDGFIPKQTDSRVVLDTINQILSGKTVFIKSTVVNNYGIEAPKELALLSQREKEILRMIKKGMNSKEIAEELYLSAYTVETHRKNICSKLNLNQPGALNRYASSHDF
jgi:two-component system, NarL family, nitrate/nitrite response regulator NarL